MIRNHDELLLARKQLALIEEALASLRRDVLPKNNRNFEVLSEGYVDQIGALQAEIAAHRGRETATGKGPTRKRTSGRARSSKHRS